MRRIQCNIQGESGLNGQTYTIGWFSKKRMLRAKVYWSFMNRFRPFRPSSALKFVRSRPIHWRPPRNQSQNTCLGLKDRTQDVHKNSAA